jgi:hypothetical protein
MIGIVPSWFIIFVVREIGKILITGNVARILLGGCFITPFLAAHLPLQRPFRAEAVLVGPVTQGLRRWAMAYSAPSGLTATTPGRGDAQGPWGPRSMRGVRRRLPGTLDDGRGTIDHRP